MFTLSACSYPSPFFFFNDTATPEIYTLSLHDALPIFSKDGRRHRVSRHPSRLARLGEPHEGACSVFSAILRDASDRKSTRLNSSHRTISYAVFCLKKKKKEK